MVNNETKAVISEEANGKFNEGDLKDLEVLERIKSGDREAFKFIYDKYYNYIFYYCFQRLYSPQTAEDATNEILTKVYLSIDKYTVNYTFNSWVWTIVSNHVIDHVRYQDRNPISAQNSYTITNQEYAGDEMNTIDINQIVYDGRNPEENLSVKELVKNRDKFICGLLDKMSERDRKIVMMYYFEDKSYEEIASELDIKLNSMRVYLKRAKEQMRKLIGSMDMISDYVTV